MKHFLELQLAAIEPNWTAEGKGGYWWGVKIGLETALNKYKEFNPEEFTDEN
jgi:hypothetical protein